eukprot:325840-Hanusia_phi.AAC.1
MAWHHGHCAAACSRPGAAGFCFPEAQGRPADRITQYYRSERMAVLSSNPAGPPEAVAPLTDGYKKERERGG